MRASFEQDRTAQRAGMLLPKSSGIPVFVMLPLDTWGAVERGPGQYVWNGYKQLLEMVRSSGLKLQVVFSFHSCGENVGDTAHVPLPAWVLRCGENDPDLFFTDRPRGGAPGQRNREYLSVWADIAPGALAGRSIMQCYEDFMASFRDTFSQDLGSVVEEVVVGAGPCGELRFPSYVEANGWRFPGVGEFQCYDRRALASLAEAAREAGHNEWGYGGPHDTGEYNSTPEDTGFYNHEGSWDSPYGRFFLGWYSSSLMLHGDRLMAAARRVFKDLVSERTAQQEHKEAASASSSPTAEKASTPGAEASRERCPLSSGDNALPTTPAAQFAQPMLASSSATAQVHSSSHYNASSRGRGSGGVSLERSWQPLPSPLERSSQPLPSPVDDPSSNGLRPTLAGASGRGQHRGEVLGLGSQTSPSCGRAPDEVQSAAEDEAGPSLTPAPSPLHVIVSGCLGVDEDYTEAGGGAVSARRCLAVGSSRTPNASHVLGSMPLGMDAGGGAVVARGASSASEPDLRRRERTSRAAMINSVALTLKIAGIQ